MASALPLADSHVEVILTGPGLPHTEEVATHLETLADFEVSVLARFDDPRVSPLATNDFVTKFRGYDHVVTF